MRCTREGFEWTAMHDGGTCSGTPVRVLYPATARLVECEGTTCAVQLRYAFGGETAMREGAERLLAELERAYGPGTWWPVNEMPCPRVEGDVFGCVLDGVGIVEYRWVIYDPADRDDTCEDPHGLISIRAQGDRGTHDGRVSITYVTQRAASAFADPSL